MTTWYEFKFVCSKCGAVHYYRPLKGCQRCGKFYIKKVSNMTEEPKEDNYLELKLTIDKYDLENEWAEHPTMVLFWAENVATAHLQFDGAKQRIELAKAETDREIRTSPSDFNLEKITDKSVEATIIIQPEYQAALRNLNSAKHDLKIAEAAMTALEHRRKGLSCNVELYCKNYISNQLPKTSSKEGKDFETHKIRTRGQRRQQLMEDADNIDLVSDIEPSEDDYIDALIEDDLENEFEDD